MHRIRKTRTGTTRIGLALLVLAALLVGAETEEPPAAREVTVPLKPTAPTKESRLGYSSPRQLRVERTVPRFLFEIPKFKAEEPLFFRVALGETGGEPFYGALDTASGSTYHNLLYLDRNRDLDLTNDGEPVEARIRTIFTTEAKLVEFLDIRLDLPYKVDGETKTEPYSCVFFYVLEHGAKTPDAVLVERDGWREGTVDLEGKSYVVAIVDDDSDGQFSTSDSWVLRPAETAKSELLARDALRTMLFPSWSDDQKWTVEVKRIDPRGIGLDLAIKPAKETERDYFLRVAKARQSPEEQKLRIDPLRPKAGANVKVDWLTGKDAAYARDIAASPRVQKPVLLAFESKSCRWCAVMAKYTFRDREVVHLADRFVCAKIDFKPGTDDVTKYKVEGTPTYVIVGLNGGEIARQTGFLRPAEFAAWLKSALR